MYNIYTIIYKTKKSKKNQLKYYIKDKKGNKIGFLMAFLDEYAINNNPIVFIGWSLCNTKYDKFDKYKAEFFAYKNIYNEPPQSIQHEYNKFLIRCFKYYKDKKIIYYRLYKKNIMYKELREYIKDKKGNRIGVLNTRLLNDGVVIGWSLCNTKYDKFDKHKAIQHANINFCNVPKSIRNKYIKFVNKCSRYYKDKTVIYDSEVFK